mmetsp:Transcript_19594/g.25377  ORF Transcript_19594/g.25377 Transcript_19594/m.25377 type:complete len:318 (-) Transcript_19594:105-1058(-)
MPGQPYLDHEKTKVDGLAFIGLSLTRKSSQGHPDSITHQEAFDLNEVIDREYKYFMSTNDDGWLVGGGEPGPPSSYKLAAKDSGHVEIMRIGTYKPEWGGISQSDIVKAMESGEILIPQMDVVPTAVVANPDKPPELEIRFDMDPFTFDSTSFLDVESQLPANWQIRFLHNQLFTYFKFASRFCPGPFHSTIVRKADFRSEKHKQNYFAKCDEVVKKWRSEGPKPLNTKWDIEGKEVHNPPEYFSGVWLFTDRNNITHHFSPNFLPPYNTPEKRKIIADTLKDIWDDQALKWKPASESLVAPQLGMFCGGIFDLTSS